MATKTVVCPDCNEIVPYGRFSCPACGTLIAAVAGGPPRSTPLASVAVEEAPTLDDDPPAPAPSPVRTTRRRTRGQAAGDAVADATGRVVDAATSAARRTKAATTASGRNGGTGATRRAAGPTTTATSAAATSPDAASDPGRPTGPRTPPILEDWPADRPIPGMPAGSRPYETEVDWDPNARPSGHAGEDGHAGGDGRATNAHPAAAGAVFSAMPSDAPGAYLPPSAAWTPGSGSSVASAVIGGGVFGHGTASPMGPPGGRLPAAALGPSGDQALAPQPPGAASLRGDLPFDAPDSLAGWLVAVGAAIATVSFLLPWAERVLGASGGGYMVQWGLGNVANLLVFLGMAALLALSAVANRVPAWVRLGVLPLAAGGLLLGLVWPYLFVSFTRFGSLVGAVGGLLLVIGGLLAVRPARHARGGPGV